MTGLESIIKEITDEARASAAEASAKAEAEAAALIGSARAEAEAEAKSIGDKAKADVAAIDAASRAAADLASRRAMLAARGEAIEAVLDAAREKLTKLSDDDYFDLIIRMVKRYAPDGEGEIAFNAADTARAPKDLEARINATLKDKKARLTLAKTAAKIDGGFLLMYGGVEENCSFDALFYSDREELQDAVSALLFA